MVMQRYEPKKIEPKWQKWWDEQKTYQADLDSSKPKYIGMSMFNYPSGLGIHIGHAMNYTISDVMARFKRQQGYESYHPVGWDAFGLPAENFAIKSGISPQESMAKIIPGYHKQYKAMGWSNDWSKEIATHEPEYYKWTQWIFSEMYRDGLAYQDARMQWWCTKCQTVLANEQVIDNKCWRHDSPDDPEVTKKEVKQWFFKITDYADELLEAIDDLDWTETVKLAQKNWIGRSAGAEVSFAIAKEQGREQRAEGKEEKITVFTTRPDTIYGAAFLVVAPESDIVSRITSEEQRNIVDEYRRETVRKSDIERQESKEKTGVFTGAYAINPANGAKLPIWVADFVLAGYGTGAVFADACDERDFEFAKKFEIPLIVTVVPENDDVLKSQVENLELPYVEEGILVNSDKYTGMHTSEAREKITAELVSKRAAREVTNYKIRDWSVSRQRYWGAPIPIIYCPDHGAVLVPDEDLPVKLPEIKDYAPTGDGRSALARAEKWLKAPCPKCGKEGERETDTLDTYICSSWYMLRYADPHNNEQAFSKENVNKWLPVDFYNGGDHATAHMIYARFVTRFFHKKGLIKNPEPFKKFLFNGKVTASDGQMFSKSKGNGVDPLEIIEQGYGADALRTYLMFAAPLELWIRWDPQGVPGTYRFINRVWNICQEYLEKGSELRAQGSGENVLKLIHPAIKKVTEDLEEQKYNTAIAAMMKATNDLYELKAKDGFEGSGSWQFALESLVMLMAPFAPHAAEQLWHDLGHEDSVHKGHWPAWEGEYLVHDTITLAVQINGKLRGTVDIAKDASEEEALAAAKNEPKVKTYLTGELKKVIYVPGRNLNLVV